MPHLRPFTAVDPLVPRPLLTLTLPGWVLLPILWLALVGLSHCCHVLVAAWGR